MAEYHPGSEALAWVQTIYSKKIHVNAYNRKIVTQHFKDLNEESQSGKPGQTFQWFTHANLARTSVTSTTNLQGIPYVANTEVAISGSASALLVAVQVDLTTIWRMVLDPRDTLKESIELSLAEGMDAAGAQLAASMVANSVGSNASTLDKSLLSQARSKLSIGAKRYYIPGTTPAWFFYHPNQDIYAQNVVDWTASYARGDAEKPNVDGVINRASGFDWIMTPLVYSAGGIMYNFVATEYSHGFGYNQRTKLLVQEFDAVIKLIGIADFMVMILKDPYGCVIQTQV